LIVRQATEADIEPLAQLWHEGWHDAHAAFSPAEILKVRTIESFAERLAAAPSDTFVLGSPDSPIGFFMLRSGELKSFYVARSARCSGAATTLLAAAEAEFARRGIARPWLACGIENLRAARFYEKWGWRNVGVQVNRVTTTGGMIAVQVWRFEKE
jgi:GNAT superfamily N-acetyltransferase